MGVKETLAYRLAHLRNEVRLPRSQRVDKRTIADLILNFLKDAGPATADLIAGVLGINLVTARARVTELHNIGLIHFCGYRYTASHRLQKLYRVES